MASTSSIWNSLSAAPRARFFFLAFPISGVRAVLVERLKYIQRLQSPDCQKENCEASPSSRLLGGQQRNMPRTWSLACHGICDWELTHPTHVWWCLLYINCKKKTWKWLANSRNPFTSFHINVLKKLFPSGKNNKKLTSFPGRIECFTAHPIVSYIRQRSSMIPTNTNDQAFRMQKKTTTCLPTCEKVLRSWT